MKRIDVLDGLRGLAVMMVFLSHTAGRDQALMPFLDFKGIGHIGVYLFFTLSAFLLGLGILSKPLNSKSIKAFFIKRSLRIIPLYYTVITGVYLFQKYSNSYSPKYLHISNGFQGYLEHLVFYRGDGIFWSIVSEIQFYLLVPVFAWILLKFKKKGIYFLCGLAIINFILYLSKYAKLNDYILYVSPNTLERGTFIDIFLPGLILAYFVVFKMEIVERNSKLIHRLATSLLLFGGLLTLILISDNFLGFHQPFYEFRFFSLLFGMAFSLITLSMYLGNPQLNKYFKNKLLRLIGKVGFSFYLLHMAVFEIINSTNIASPLKFLISFGIVMLVSMTTFRLIEQNSINLSYRLINNLGLSTKKKAPNSNT